MILVSKKYLALFPRTLILCLQFYLALICLGFFQLVVPSKVEAQVIEPPTKKFLFFEDVTDLKKSRKKKREIQLKQTQVMKKARAAGFPYDINATSLKYDSANKKLIGDGGVIIGYASSIVEADHGEIETEDKTATLEGDVRVTDISGSISADKMKLNLEDGTGFFKKADLYFEDGHYRFLGDEVAKVGKDDFEITECTMTTCDCADSDSTDPWRIEGKSSELTREGYGTIYDGILYAYNIPVFYTPYLKFPVKSKRSSGFLPGSFGGGEKSGYSMTLPLYLVIDESTDATVTPVYSSKARIGMDDEFREIFSDNTVLDMGGLYFNESIRDKNNFLGLDVSNLRNRWDPSQVARKGVLSDLIGTNRFGGYLNFSSLNNKLFGQDLEFIVNGKTVSDDVLLREYDKPEIAPYTTRFITSRATARYNFLDNYSLDTAVEYNEDMVGRDDRIFQRLPDVALQGLHVYRPFGQNDLGAKVVINDSVTDTQFVRDQLFDGNRAEIYETASVPFHYKNYFDVTVGADARATSYKLDNVQNVKTVSVVQPDGTSANEEQIYDLKDSSDRVLPGFSAEVSSVLEKVYNVEDGNPLKYIAELGSRGRSGELTRIKQTLEPDIRYRYVPEVDQSDNPQFDSFDQLPKRNLVTYSLMQRFYGRYEGRDQNIYGIEETTPEPADLGVLSTRTPIDQAFDLGMPNSSDSFYRAVAGVRPELFNFMVAQTYDIETEKTRLQTKEEKGIEPDPFSDVSFRTNIIPNEYFRINGGGSLGADDRDFSEYDIGSQFLDKRGDQLRLRVSFTDGSSGPVRQSEQSLELRLTDRFKLGFYGRYDDVKKEFFEKKVGMRLNSSCNCWTLDLDVWDRIQPDETIFQFVLTLNGLGSAGFNPLTQKGSNYNASQ